MEDLIKADDSKILNSIPPKIIEEKLLAQVKKCYKSSDLAFRWAKYYERRKKQCEKGLVTLEKTLKSLQAQQKKLSSKLEMLKKKYPESKGFQAPSAGVVYIFKSLKKYGKRWKKTHIGLKKVLKKETHRKYKLYYKKLKKIKKSPILRRSFQADQDLAALIQKNEKWSQDPIFLQRIQENRWMERNQGIGEKRLGNWYKKLMKKMNRYKKRSRAAIRCRDRSSGSEIFVIRCQQILEIQKTMQEYGKRIEKLEWRLYRLQSIGINLEETLKEKKAKSTMPSQIQKINTLMLYIEQRKINIDISDWLEKLETNISKLYAQIERKKVQSETISAILLSVKRIDYIFSEKYGALFSEIIALEDFTKK